tara:strand:+ start:7022 stop:8053 length:1032 start_codon:yes stop_codon:yes gene_type:complete
MMNNNTLISFRDLFLGFPFAYGTDEGGCRWADVDTMWEKHLSGEEMIGIYPMVYDPLFTRGGPDSWTEGPDNNRHYVEMEPDLWMCKWGSVDIDEGDDSLVIARNTQKILQAIDIVAWPERSRSKGYHLWIFNEEWVRASVIRRALKAALDLAGAEYDAVYPKQDSLAGPPGNYMRLPYGGNRLKNRQEILDGDETIPYVGEFVTLAEADKTPTSALIRAASLYEDPMPVVPDLPPKRDYSKEPLMNVDGSRLRGLSSEMFNNGPVPYYKGHGAGKGRHGFLNRFARSMFESGYTHVDVISWTKDLDSRLGQWWDDGPKFAGRHDCERQIERLVKDAQQRATR